MAIAELRGRRGEAVSAAALRRRFAKFTYEGLRDEEKLTYTMLTKADTPEKFVALSTAVSVEYPSTPTA